MADVRLVDSTLFGEWDAHPRSAGEFLIGKEILANWHDMRERSEWCMENLPYTGDILLEDEDHRLLRESMSAYIFGLYAVTVISADAFLERIITDYVETHGIKAGRFGFGKTLAIFSTLKILDGFTVKRISRLHEIRNNLAHEKGPDHPLRVFRRSIARRMRAEDILKEDAKEAVTMAYGLAGKLIRNFPRLALPGVGTPTLYRSPYHEE